jgi:tetratricopeptide (TPR) repeat protein
LIKKRQRDYSDAVLLFKKSLELNPRNVNALNNLGNLYIETGDLDKAHGMFGAAINIGSGIAASFIGLGNIAEIRNQYDVHFITCAVVEWVDVFSRNIYADILLHSFLKH